MPDSTWQQATAWIGRPFNAVLLLAFLAAAFHHTAAGLQVVIEDYVRGELARMGVGPGREGHLRPAVADGIARGAADRGLSPGRMPGNAHLARGHGRGPEGIFPAARNG